VREDLKNINETATFWDQTVCFGTAAVEIKIRCLCIGERELIKV